MLRNLALHAAILALALPFASAADTKTTSGLSAAAIVEKNVAARGGLQAWRAVQTLTYTGKLDAGGNNRPTLAVASPGVKKGALPPPRPKEQVQLPFTWELKRPRKERIEIEFKGQKSLQVFDGTNGWKLRLFLNRHQVEPYTAYEMSTTATKADLDGYLIDYAAKGTKIDLVGPDKVQGRDAYDLKVTLQNGKVRHVWVDAKTFLEAKIEGDSRPMDGKMRPVFTYPSDYRAVNGLTMPFLNETSVESTRQTEKMQIEKITVNPKLDDSLFAKPN